MQFVRWQVVATMLVATANLLPLAQTVYAQATFPGNAIMGPRWRHIGPFRAGRTKSAVGVPTQPNVFYMAPTNGGVWKTNDYGRTWNPIFDDQNTGSIGAVEVAPSDPNVIYVGSGEGLQRPDLSTGDGLYRSSDAGKTWTHLGLRDGQQIPRIAIDPRNPDRIFVAVLGHPYGANTERGIYRSTNGGRTLERVLYKDDHTGGADVVLSPDNPNIVYAVLWEGQQGPWENAAWNGPGSGLMKSVDGGTTWTQLAGLPTPADGLGRIGIGISPSDPKRIYITATAGDKSGIWRSDDAGATWTRTTSDSRYFGRSDDFASITVDPRDPNTLYTMNVVVWKSSDGGYTWKSYRGAPGGDDYQRMWINPLQPSTIILVADQGAMITVNAGETWSSWYNQPTAQFYHVTADNAWPYRLCGGQQESGSACVSSRGNDGSIGYREFRPVGASEYSYVAPDPLDPDILYGGTVTRFDRRTGQTQNVSPVVARGRGGAGALNEPDYYRGIRTMPILFSPTNPRKLYYGTNVVWQTVNGGRNWTRLSGDLSRETWEVPASVGKYASTPGGRATRRGVVYTIAPSPIDSNTIWAGTDDGLIHVTRDNGKTWRNVTPPMLKPWMKVSIMDASHSSAGTAYAAINTLRLDDLRPHILRTRDGGATWTEIVSGIDSGATINSVKEDPKKKGLLFAGSELQVWFSMDDGDHWHPLRLNMPAISIRDLTIKDDDLAVGTHGRGFWILDNINALRQWSAATPTSPVTLFKPPEATRVRYSMYTDTPVPPEEPHAENPPDGAIIDYYLATPARVVTIEILDAARRVIRKYSSGDSLPPVIDRGNDPWYWFRPPVNPPTTAGLQRFTWDLHYARPTTACSLPISATPYNTKCEPEGPFVMPGPFMVRLTADGVVQEQRFTVRMDPRVKMAALDIRRQHDLSVALYDAMSEARTNADLARTAGQADYVTQFNAIGSSHQPVIDVLQEADGALTNAMLEAANARLTAWRALKTRWDLSRRR